MKAVKAVVARHTRLRLVWPQSDLTPVEEDCKAAQDDANFDIRSDLCELFHNFFEEVCGLVSHLALLDLKYHTEDS